MISLVRGPLQVIGEGVSITVSSIHIPLLFFALGIAMISVVFWVLLGAAPPDVEDLL